MTPSRLSCGSRLATSVSSDTGSRARSACPMSRLDGANDWPLWDEPLPISADTIAWRWARALVSAYPWNRMQPDDLTGEIRRLAIALINLACDDDETRRRQIVIAAREHGLFRRNQGVQRRALAAELATLRDAICDALRSSHWSHFLIQQAMEAVVVDIRLARQVAARAFDRNVNGYAQAEP
jgi:hypothetical protein